MTIPRLTHIIAADAIALLERRDATARRIRAVASALVVLAIVCLASYCTGRSRGAATVRAATVDSVRRVRADSSTAIEARLAARAPLMHRAETAAVVARAAHAAAAKPIVVLSDSTVSIDNGPPVKDVPAALIIPELRTCTAAIAADTIEIHAVVAQLADMTQDRDTWRSRAELDEAHQSRAPRFGFRSGVVTGASLIVVLLHFFR